MKMGLFATSWAYMPLFVLFIALMLVVLIIGKIIKAIIRKRNEKRD